MTEPITLTIKSTFDQTDQLARGVKADGRAPLLVQLHTWGGTYEQNAAASIAQCQARGWHFIQPHFRGPNRTPPACGSAAARQDVIDAVDWAIENWDVDQNRIYLYGGSGGGHMTLTVASYFPERFTAASAWCPITEIAQWHAEHIKEDGTPDGYAKDIEGVADGKPVTSEEVQRDFKSRSPLYHIANATDLPLDINHGVMDGKTGSVPFHHSIDAFNAIAAKLGKPTVSQEEHDQLDVNAKLTSPLEGDTAEDITYEGRAIYLRRQAGNARLTIFEGGHDICAPAAFAWLSQFTKGEPTTNPPVFISSNDATSSEIAG